MAVRLAFEVLGMGPPVVILHGLFGAGSSWKRLAQSLSASHSVYLPDARNHGASPWAESMSYPEMAQDVLDLIVREQLEHPFVIGHSMGGKTAMALALLHPEAIDGVAVVDIAPMHYAGQFASHVAAMRGVDLAGAEHRRKIRQMLASRLEGDAPVDFLMQNLRRQNDCFDWRLNLMATAVCMPDLCGFPEALHGRRYEGPALFVSGGESDYVGNESHARILRMFPHAQLQSIAEAGHWVHADQPDALLCALHEWLSDAVASAPR